MVIPEMPPSRAATLTLIGGELAFDFANTSSGRGWPSHMEHLRAPGDVADWAGHAHVLPPADAEWLKQEAGRDSRLGESLLGAALALREDIFEIGRELANGRAPPPAAIDRVNATHAHCLAKARLAPFEGRFVWNWRTRADPVEAVLGPISLSAMTTLMQADLTRVKQCQGEKCGWLFLDMTKNKSRRWCEMEVCGNRAKQKRHARKSREP
jgi:predicted RNA-binding Zn ribbon-like protein